MKKLLLSLSLCLLPSLAHAQEINSQWKMPCDQVVRMGFDKYFQAYQNATKDYSTAGQKDACYRYTRCRHEANRKLMATLPTVRRQRLNAAQYQLTQFEDALWAMTELRAGGGTMYGLFAANAQATREDWLALAIAATKRAQRSPSFRAQANRNWAKSQSQLKSWRQIPATDSPSAIPDMPRLYRQNLQQANEAVTRLRLLSAQLPDEVAALLTQRLARSARHDED
jgi:hypothetical protein